MAEEQANNEGGAPSAPNPEIEREARGMGWRPKEEFRGDTTHWVDAETFVRRGKEFIPILRAENGRLKNQVDATANELKEVKAALAAATEAIEGLREFQSEASKRAAQAARADLVKQLKEAREAEDVEREAEILSGIGDLDAAVREAKKEPPKKEEKPTPSGPKVDPAYVEWEKDNQWIVTDGRRRALAIQIAAEMREDRANDGLKGREFFDAVAAEVDKVFGERALSKVDGGRSGGSGGPARQPAKETGRTYDDLPADAKKACSDLAKKVVGANRAYKDEASWKTAYAKEYFAGETA